jgi:hypothetical protein
MLEFSSTLATMLGNATTKLAWSNAFIAGLGSSRRLICTRNGTPFIDVALTGAITTAGGNITGFGKASSATVQEAADLSTGPCLLRIEGNGNYVQGTLGLPGSGADFILSANPTATSGIGIGATTKILAPATMPSGTGPAAPDLDANAITAFRLWDYSVDENSPIDRGTVQLNVRDPDIVMDRPYMAQDIGDIRVMRVADGAGLVLGTGGDCYKFGASTLSMNAAANSEANVPLHQFEGRCKPHGRWANWPFRGNFNIAVDTLIPPAHKIDLLRADGTVIDVIEMYSTRVNNVPGTGWPVNSVRMKQDITIAPVQPFWTCGMVHVYQSHQPKMTSFAQHLITPMRDDGLFHPKNVSERASSPQAWPLISGDQTYMGMGAIRVAPKWSRKIEGGLDTTIVDTAYAQVNTDQHIAQWIGYGHEPGAIGGQTVYTGYGGSRHDRGPFDTTMQTWITFPNGTRVHGAVPNRTMALHRMLNFFNLHQHFYTDVERGVGIQKSKVLNGEICSQDTFYAGGSEAFRPDLDNNGVRILAAQNKGASGPLDKNGRRFTQEQSRDYLHSNSNAAIGAYIGRSPLHVRGAAHSFVAHVLCAFDLTQSFRRWEFLTRQHAWFEKAFVEMWVVANNSPGGFSSNEIEAMWQRHLERMHDVIMPYYLSGTDVWSVTLRNLGMGSEIITLDSGVKQINFNEDSKSCYMGEPLMLMKQSGAWDVMYAKSQKCAAMMDLIVSSLIKYTTGPIVDANGVGIDKYYYDKLPTISNATMASVDLMNAALSDWGKVYPPDGQMDWIRGTDGVIGSQNNNFGIDGTNTMHYRAQALFILKDFGFASGARIDAAIAKVNNWYSQVHTGFLAGQNNKFDFRFLMMGIHTAPDFVGPPVQ